MALAGTGLNPQLANILQENTLERAYRDALFPRLMYRGDAMPSRWQANIGEELLFTRAGLLPVVTDPSVPGQDPTPQNVQFEQWRAIANQYDGTVDTNMVDSRTALAPKVIRDAQQLGMQGGQSLNRLARNAYFRAYLSGNTVTAAAASSGATSIQVASVSGFLERLNPVRPTSVSAANPLPVSFAGTADPVNVIGAIPDNAAQPFGRGTLLLDAGLSANLPIRNAVLADNRAVISRVGGAATVDALTTSSTLTMQEIIDSALELEANLVPKHVDGRYHCHLDPRSLAQLFRDNQWQRQFQSLPDSDPYKNLAIGEYMGCLFFKNTESPSPRNTSTGNNPLVGSGNDAQVSNEIGGEVRNASGVAIGRVLITGGDSLVEKYIDESEYISEAGVTGKIGNFSITNNGIMVMTQRIRYTMRAPLDRKQQKIAQTWSWSGDFVVPSDQLSETSPARYKRSIVIEHGATG
jgi:hypothetical protein